MSGATTSANAIANSEARLEADAAAEEKGTG